MEINNKSKMELSAKKVNKIISWMKRKVLKAGKRGIIFGLSGGLDSAVVAALGQQAFPDNTMALILPCESIAQDIEDAMEIVNRYHLNYQQIDLTSIYHQLLSIMDTSQDNKMAKANIKPRLRMIVLYYFAAFMEYLVVGTSNKSEIAIGYFTKYGDGGVDILPLGNILKSEIYDIARFLEIPQKIISKPPSGGLWEEQTDEQEMGFSYEQLDNFLKYGKLEDKKTEEAIVRMSQSSAHKRTRPPILNI